MNAYPLANSGLLGRLNGIPVIGLATKLRAARQGGCRTDAVVREIVRLGAGIPGETSAEQLKPNGDRL